MLITLLSRQTGIQRVRQAEIQTGIQTGRQTDRHNLLNLQGREIVSTVLDNFHVFDKY